MKKKYKVSPLAEHIEDYADMEFDDIENDVKNTDSWDLDTNAFPINHKADRYISAAAWFHEMKTRGMTPEEERYVELMLIELADFYFADLSSRKLSKKCREALGTIGKSIKEDALCTKS